MHKIFILLITAILLQFGQVKAQKPNILFNPRSTYTFEYDTLVKDTSNFIWLEHHYVTAEPLDSLVFVSKEARKQMEQDAKIAERQRLLDLKREYNKLQKDKNKPKNAEVIKPQKIPKQ